MLHVRICILYGSYYTVHRIFTLTDARWILLAFLRAGRSDFAHGHSPRVWRVRRQQQYKSTPLYSGRNDVGFYSNYHLIAVSRRRCFFFLPPAAYAGPGPHAISRRSLITVRQSFSPITVSRRFRLFDEQVRNLIFDFLRKIHPYPPCHADAGWMRVCFIHVFYTRRSSDGALNAHQTSATRVAAGAPFFGHRINRLPFSNDRCFFSPAFDRNRRSFCLGNGRK